LVGTVPSNPSGTKLEVYGTHGTLTITGGSLNAGPNKLALARGKEPLAEVQPPDELRLIPDSTPAGPARNVGQAYARFAAAVGSGEPFQPDFAHAVRRHKLIEAIERSSAEGRVVRL